MGDTESSSNTLHKTKHTRISILGYRVGLDGVATYCLVGLIEGTPKSLARSNLTT